MHNQVYIKLDCGNAVEELDPLTGEVCEVETVADGEGVCFTRIRDGDEPNLFCEENNRGWTDY